MNDLIDPVKVVFQRSLSLETGEDILISFPSSSQRENFRGRFNAEKKRYSMSFGRLAGDSITCSKRTEGGKFYLVISKASIAQSTPVIVRRDGSVEAIDMTPGPWTKAPSVDLGEMTIHGETEAQRIERLQREDLEVAEQQVAEQPPEE